jgi:hypothetical protein
VPDLVAKPFPEALRSQFSSVQ